MPLSWSGNLFQGNLPGKPLGSRTATPTRAIVGRIPPYDISGSGYAFMGQDGLCRRIADIAYARWNLVDGNDLTVRELSLLADIIESATRTALNREGISAPEQVQEKAEVSRDFMEALMAGHPLLDLYALQRVGALLEIAVPQFGGAARFVPNCTVRREQGSCSPAIGTVCGVMVMEDASATHYLTEEFAACLGP